MPVKDSFGIRRLTILGRKYTVSLKVATPPDERAENCSDDRGRAWYLSRPQREAADRRVDRAIDRSEERTNRFDERVEDFLARVREQAGWNDPPKPKKKAKKTDKVKALTKPQEAPKTFFERLVEDDN